MSKEAKSEKFVSFDSEADTPSTEKEDSSLKSEVSEPWLIVTKETERVNFLLFEKQLTEVHSSLLDSAPLSSPSRTVKDEVKLSIIDFLVKVSSYYKCSLKAFIKASTIFFEALSTVKPETTLKELTLLAATAFCLAAKTEDNVFLNVSDELIPCFFGNRFSSKELFDCELSLLDSLGCSILQEDSFLGLALLYAYSFKVQAEENKVRTTALIGQLMSHLKEISLLVCHFDELLAAEPDLLALTVLIECYNSFDSEVEEEALALFSLKLKGLSDKFPSGLVEDCVQAVEDCKISYQSNKLIEKNLLSLSEGITFVEKNSI